MNDMNDPPVSEIILREFLFKKDEVANVENSREPKKMKNTADNTLARPVLEI